MTLLERASRYVAALPAAISGSRGHDALFRAACVLTNGFDLPDAQAWPILLEYNASCLPPWNERELRHKLSQASKVVHLNPAGHLLGEEKKSAPLPRVLGRIALPDTALAPVEPPPIANESEAHRIAGELTKMKADGAITGPHDPEARFYAHVIHTFGGTYTCARYAFPDPFR